MTALVQTAFNLVLKPLQSVENVMPPATKTLQSVENVPSCPKTFSRQEVRQHCDSSSCWIIVDYKVYDITKFLDLHPGGEEIMLEHAGCEASSAFWDKGHSKNAVRMLQQYYIGDLKT